MKLPENIIFMHKNCNISIEKPSIFDRITGCPARARTYKNDGFCIKKDELWIKNHAFCIKNDGFCIKNHESYIKNHDTCI